jgi:hypothetical protein
MRARAAGVLWVAVAVAATCAACGGGGDRATCSLGAAALPADGTVGDYALNGGVTQADTAQQLYDLIDGAGDRYTSAGFVCLRSGRYSSTGGAADITVSIYDQGSTSGATAVYDAYATSGQGALSPTRGDASRENTSLPLNYEAYMRVGRIFVDVVGDSPQSRDSAIAMLDAVLAGVGE